MHIRYIKFRNPFRPRHVTLWERFEAQEQAERKEAEEKERREALHWKESLARLEGKENFRIKCRRILHATVGRKKLTAVLRRKDERRE